MLRSLYAGVSGLRAHQMMLDVVGNNIANVNTSGFKGSTVVFQDLLSQVIAGAGAPAEGVQGGTNPSQVGLGVGVGAIWTNFSQGALENTGKSTDVAIQGDGFFIANQGGQQIYTRAGAFTFDGHGNLVTPNGSYIQGWTADPATGDIDHTVPVGNLTMPPGQILPPVNTNSVVIGKMLSANAPIGQQATTTITAFDTQGVAADITFIFEKTAVNTWTIDSFDPTGANIGSHAVNFDPLTGYVAGATTFTVQPTTPAANWPNPITVDLGVPGSGDALQEFGGTITVSALQQNGSPAGTLQSFKIANDGVISGVFSNGVTKQVGQLALAVFNNPAGLEKVGDNFYRVTPNSGLAQVGVAATGGRGKLSAGNLEMSNVDLSLEFTKLIIGQRGFQANSKIITTSDDILQTLLTLKN